MSLLRFFLKKQPFGIGIILEISTRRRGELWLESMVFKKLHQKLKVVLNQVRDLWILKSRINWLIQGDHNTSFYHLSPLARRKMNHIALVKDERGG